MNDVYLDYEQPEGSVARSKPSLALIAVIVVVEALILGLVAVWVIDHAFKPIPRDDFAGGAVDIQKAVKSGGLVIN